MDLGERAPPLERHTQEKAANQADLSLRNWDGLSPLLESFTTRLVLGLVLTRTPEQPEEDRKAG